MGSSKVLYFKRHWHSLIPQYLLAIIVLKLGLYVTAYYEFSVLVIPLSFNGHEINLRLPVFLLLFIFVLARPIIQLYDSYFEVSDKHLRIVRGCLSLIRRKQEFAFEDLLGVQVTQSILDRILRVGNIEVGSKTNVIKLKMSGLKNPEFYAKEITKRIDSSRIAEKEIDSEQNIRKLFGSD
jgi:uncharacterized membrane protein YdbT with pleckstrin-like domain